MREARNWLAGFNPESVQDILDAGMRRAQRLLPDGDDLLGHGRSLVNHGAIDDEMFNDANGEHFFFFAKFSRSSKSYARTAAATCSTFGRTVMRMPNAKEAHHAHAREDRRDGARRARPPSEQAGGRRRNG